jgi:hypothetical protein
MNQLPRQAARLLRWPIAKVRQFVGLKQAYEQRRTTPVIVVDDSSIDNTVELARDHKWVAPV